MVDESRREFLKKGASLAGVAAVAPLLPEEKIGHAPIILHARATPVIDFSLDQDLDYDDKKMMRKMDRTVKFVHGGQKTILHISHPTPLKHIYQWERWLRRNKEEFRKYLPSFTGIYPYFFELSDSTVFANRKSFYNLRMGGLKVGDEHWYSIDRVNHMAGRMWANNKEINTGSMLQWDKKYIFESEHSGKREKIDLLGSSSINMFVPIVITPY